MLCCCTRFNRFFYTFENIKDLFESRTDRRHQLKVSTVPSATSKKGTKELLSWAARQSRKSKNGRTMTFYYFPFEACRENINPFSCDSSTGTECLRDASNIERKHVLSPLHNDDNRIFWTGRGTIGKSSLRWSLVGGPQPVVFRADSPFRCSVPGQCHLCHLGYSRLLWHIPEKRLEVSKPMAKRQSAVNRAVPQGDIFTTNKFESVATPKSVFSSSFVFFLAFPTSSVS